MYHYILYYAMCCVQYCTTLLHLVALFTKMHIILWQHFLLVMGNLLFPPVCNVILVYLTMVIAVLLCIQRLCIFIGLTVIFNHVVVYKSY